MKWVLNYSRQYSTFQFQFFVLVTDTYQKSYIPGKLRPRLFFILKIPIFLINLTDFDPETNRSTGKFSTTNAPTLEYKLANKTS